MIKKTKNKLITSLLLAAMVIPAFSINAQAAASAPRYTYHTAECGWDAPNFYFDKDGNFVDTNVDEYSGKTEVTVSLNPLYGDEYFEARKTRKINIVQKATKEANNPALPFIKVSMNDFMCIYGPMYGDLATKYEGCYFDSVRYAKDYPDVVAAVGNTHTALWNHYKTAGIYEGRKGYVTNLYGAITNSRNIYMDLADVWTPQMTDVEIVTWVNKWLCNNMTYSFDNSADYGHVKPGQAEALIGKVEANVCGGYASKFETIMINLGIPCVYVSDMGQEHHDGGHAWNQVYVNGQWKVVDVTWNDGDQEGGKEGPDNTRLLLVDHHPREGSFAPGGAAIRWIEDNIYSVADSNTTYY